MNAIDQRILIPANPDVIWDVISNINENPKWQVNCQHVSFLTTNHKGQGMRYRATTPKGRELVIEITAWYENVGYAYKIIDGISTRSNSGRFRLQEITEGTIVQWAFEYEPSGLLGGIKNSLGTKRAFEQEIIHSLENLWRVITEQQAGKPYISRTAMREAPDVETRAQYKARHDKPAPTSPSPNDALSSFLKMDEPSIAPDDTRPHPAEPTPASAIAPVSSDDIFSKKSESTSSEPDFLKSLEKPVDTADHSIFQPPTPEKVVEQPIIEPVQPIEPEIKAEETETESKIESLFSFEEPEPVASTESLFAEPVVDTPLEPVIETPSEPLTPAVSIEPEVTATPIIEESFKPDPIVSKPVISATDTTITQSDSDTSQKSIFEIFGLPKPSETQQMPAVVIDQPIETDQTAPPPAVEVASVPTTDNLIHSSTSETLFNDDTVGLRVKLRRKNNKVRKRH